MALTTGVVHVEISRHSVSSEKGSRSSTLPPPRAMTMTSTAGSRVELAQRVDDLRHRVRSLHHGIADRESHGRPASRGDRHDIALGGGGSAGDEPDGVGQEGKWPLEPRVEQAFGVQQLAQPLDTRQQLAETDSANLADPQAE